jgi:hypothetical protein
VPERGLVSAADAWGGIDDVAAGQSGARDLIQQRLESALDIAIDQYGRYPGTGKPAHRGETAKPRAYDHNLPRAADGRVLLGCPVTVTSFPIGR